MTEPSHGAAASPAAVDDTALFASLLASGERVLLVRQQHWFTFVQAARWFLLVLAVVASLMNMIMAAIEFRLLRGRTS